jgi:uncharacterized HhH-GPD family protein
VNVGDELVAFGRELDAARAAQVGEGFSGRPEVDGWLRADPNALLIGALFTQGIPAERAWSAPWELKGRLGHLDVDRIAAMDASEVESVLTRRPMLHRFKHTLPRYIVGTARLLVERYQGDAGRVWADEPTADVLLDRLSEFPGIGHKKAAMMVELLIRALGVCVRDHAGAQLPYDVHVRRVMLRTGLVDIDDRDRMHRAAQALAPERPSLVDLPLWLIGRTWCRPRAPRCEDCRLGSVCPRLVDRTVDGVGAKR